MQSMTLSALTNIVKTNINGSDVFKEYAKGFKQILLENLLEPDEHPSYPSRLRGDKWVRECLKPQLDSNVPVESLEARSFSGWPKREVLLRTARQK